MKMILGFEREKEEYIGCLRVWKEESIYYNIKSKNSFWDHDIMYFPWHLQ